MKKFIAILLAAAIFITVALPAAADDLGFPTSIITRHPTTTMPQITEPSSNVPSTFVPIESSTTKREPTTFEPITNKPTTTKPSITEKPTGDIGEISGNTKVAKISLCTYIHKIHFGHCWVYVENISDRPLQVGYYEVAPGEGVSLGSFFTTRYDGGGIYYNIESYVIDEHDQKGYFSITRDATLNNINNLTNYLKTFNWWDPFIMNCAGFALGAWMSAGQFIIPIPIPLIVQLQVFVMGVDMDMPMYNPGRQRVYKQKGNKLVVVSDKSADKPLSLEE